jgi:hypothetical protein
LQTHLYDYLQGKLAIVITDRKRITREIFEMKNEIRFRASHEHASSEQRCTRDLKHALVTTPMMSKTPMLPILLPD